MKFGLALTLALLPGCGLAQVPAPTPDREAVYQAALPAYADDAARPLAVRNMETRTFGDCRMVRLSYASTRRLRVPALLFLPLTASRTRPVPCLVLLHGLGGSKEQMAGLAREMAKAGYASLAIDEYGQGERVPPTKPGRSAPNPAEELAVTVRQTAVDVRRGLDVLAARPDIDSNRVGLVGVSLGAIIGTVTAGVDPRLKAVALISGGGDWGLILKTLTARNAVVGGRSTAVFQGTDWDAVTRRLAPVDPLTFAPHLAPRPLLMLCGRKDIIIVPRAAQELYDAAQQPKEIRWFEAYGHVPPPEETYPALRAFFGKQLMGL